jgi:hypothetical protein
MTKKELHAEVMKVCEEFNLPEEVKAKLDALTAPKKGGAKVSIEDITLTDDEGNITHILDSVFGVYIPVFDESGEPNFYEKPDTQLGWSRFSKMAEKVRKEAEKKFKATKDAIFADLLAGSISNDEAQELLKEAEEAKKAAMKTIPEGVEYIEPENA